MAARIAYSQNPDVDALAQELHRSVRGTAPKFVLFFASPAYEPETLGAALRRRFGDVPSLGCTTAGELVSSRMLKNSVVLAAFDDELIETVAVSAVPDFEHERSVHGALAAVARACGGEPQTLDPDRHVGLVIHDGLSVGEERVMAALSAKSNLAFVGGSAGDDLRFRATYLFLNFVPTRNVSALALLRPRARFRVVKTQSFDVLDEMLEVTDADEATRTVHSFNGRPGTEEYARALGVSESELPSAFQSRPLGLVTSGGEPFVRSPQQIRGQSVVFYCQIKQGMQLRVLRSRDIVADTRRDLQQALAGLQSCRALVNFHCILRTLELEQRGQSDAYARLFAELPTLGFSTYGESYIGHINQTSTMVLFE